MKYIIKIKKAKILIWAMSFVFLINIFGSTPHVNAATNYQIIFNANGGSNAPSTATVTSGARYTIPTAAPSRAGYAFLGWSTSSTNKTVSHVMGSVMTVTKTQTLYAVYTQITQFNQTLAVKTMTGTYHYYAFTPAYTGIYSFYTSSSNYSLAKEINNNIDKCDTYGYLYKSSVTSANLVKSNNHICMSEAHQAFTPYKTSLGWVNYNFSITERLVAGTTYYLKIGKGSYGDYFEYRLYLKSYALPSSIDYFHGSAYSNNISTSITSEQGCTIGLKKPHKGIDVGSNSGYNQYAIAKGTIKYVGTSITSTAGYYVAIDYTSPRGTKEVIRYLHLKNKPTFTVGSTIKKGALVGVTGDTGGSSGHDYPAHLHIDINTADKHSGIPETSFIDPLLYYYTGTMTYN